MKSLDERLKGKAADLGIKQYTAVLDFVTAVQEQMRAQSMSQQELAERLGKSRAWIWKVLRKKPNLTFFSAVKIADALTMKVEVRVVPRQEAAAILPGPVRCYVHREVALGVFDGGGQYSAPPRVPVPEAAVLRSVP